MAWHTPKQNTWCECDVQKSETFWDRWSRGAGVWGCQDYPPGGGETSREISGKGGAPLLSGATLSEHVTNIVVDGTAAFNKHKSFSTCLTLTNIHSNRRRNAQQIWIHPPACMKAFTHFITVHHTILISDHPHSWYTHRKTAQLCLSCLQMLLICQD